LGLPLDADRLIAELQAEMHEALRTLDAGLKRNRHVRISAKGGGWITPSPLDAQPESSNLAAFKTELNKMWPMTRYNSSTSCHLGLTVPTNTEGVI
jgi:hypothetical protein